MGRVQSIEAMSKKIEGQAIEHGGWIEFDQAPDENGPWKAATIFIAEGSETQPRAFTEEDVAKAIQSTRIRGSSVALDIMHVLLSPRITT